MAELIVLPKIGVNMVEAIIQEWSVPVGGKIKEGETLALAETDKAAQDIYAPVSGTVLAHLVELGVTVQCQEPIAVIGDEGEDIASLVSGASAESPASAPQLAPGKTSSADVAASLQPGTTRRVRISPLAKRIAGERGIDIALLSPAEPGDRITRKDVERYISDGPTPTGSAAAASAASASGGGERRIPMNRVRKIIAARMTQSIQSVPRAVLSLRVDAGGLLEWKEAAKEDGQRISITDMVLKALGRVLKEHMMINSRLDGDDIVVSDAINIGIAVHTDDGLMVPVLRDADQKGITRIASELRDLAEKARAGKLALDEMSGGTFTLTNLGMLGIEQFIPMINSPECAILAVGAVTREVVPQSEGSGTTVRPMFWVSLAFDHRIVDGGPAGKFLGDLKRALERPVSMVD